MSRFSSFLLSSVVTMFVAHGAHATDLSKAISSRLFNPSEGMFEEEFITRSIEAFRQASKGKNSIDQEDVKLQMKAIAAQQLARSVSEFISFDLDGDGFASSIEIQAVGGSQRLETVMLRDVDKDGKVSQDEWFAANAKRNGSSEFLATKTLERYAQFLALDQDASNSITFDEYKTIAGGVFRHFDTDADGRISGAEFGEWSKARRLKAVGATGKVGAPPEEKSRPPVEVTEMVQRAKEAQLPTPSADGDFRLPFPTVSQQKSTRRAAGNTDTKCIFPDVKPGEKIAIFSTYEGVKPTSINLGDETWVIDVHIEEGNEPLYVILPSYDPVVWRFNGAVDRVDKVVPTAMSRGNNSGKGMGGSGIVGIDKSKVTFLENSQCLSYFNGPVEEARMKGVIAEHIGRQPDYKGSSYHTEKISIPSMAVTEGVSSPPWADDGPALERIDPASVVAPVPVKEYGLLPGSRGLRQLVDGGYLEKIPNGNGYDQYRIIKTFPAFPTNMTGGIQPTFLLAPGVQKPGGDPGWACLIDEATGKVLSGVGGMMCR